MLEESIEFGIRENKGILKVNGQITYDNSNQIKEKIKKELSESEKVEKLIIDFLELSCLDVAGVGLILSLTKFMQKKGGSIVVEKVNKKIERVFHITKIKDIIIPADPVNSL